jgi:tetratricopeptide (TPR) repeat protein
MIRRAKHIAHNGIDAGTQFRFAPTVENHTTISGGDLMRSSYPDLLRGVTLACLLFFSASAQDGSRTPRPAATAGEAALRALAEEFYTAYSKKDLDGFLQLWSAKAPELAARRQAMQRLFADHEKIEVKGIVIRKMAVEAEKAKLRVELEMSAFQTQTGRPAAGLGRMIHELEVVKEEGAWKVRREAAAEEDLAAALASLKTDDERSALLAAERELVTERLVREVIRQGSSLRLRGNYPGALAWYSLAQKIAEQIGDQAGIATALTNVGNVYYLQGDYAQAMERFRQSLALSEAIGDKAGIATTLRGIGNIHNSQGDYPQALEHFHRSLALSEALGDKAGIARSMTNIGTAHLWQDNYAQALEYFGKSLALHEALGDKAGARGTLNNIGSVYSAQGDYAQALEYFGKSLALSEALGDKDGVRGTLNNIGNIYNRQGDYAQALVNLRKSLALGEALGDKVWIARSLTNIGGVYFGQGDYANALEHYQKSLMQAEALGDKVSLSATLSNIGSLYSDQGDYAKALENYQRSLSLRESIGDKAGIASALSGIGCVYSNQGNYAQALAHLQKSLAVSEALGDKLEASDTLNNIGNIYSGRGDYAQALEYLRKSLALSEALGSKAEIARSLHNIGNVYSGQGDYAQALGYLRKSLALCEASGSKAAESDALTDMGDAVRLQGDLAQALDFASRATALAKQFGYPNELWRAQNLAGQSYRGLNQLTPARQAFEEAIGAIEALRVQVAGGEQERQHFFEGKLAPYHSMVELLVAQGQASAALAYAERAKARVLLDVLRSGHVQVDKAMTAAERDRERGFNSQLVSLNTQISRETQRSKPDPAHLDGLKAQLQKARLDYEAFQTGLYVTHPELKAQRGEIELLTPERARALLPDTHGALLEYVVTDERTYLFALTGIAGGTTTELKVYPLEIKRKELDERATQFRETLAKGGPGFRRPARELYDLLLKPAAAQLEGRTSLVIVPDGALWELPFQALQPAPTRYLIEDYAIAYAPSLTALREMIKLRDGRKDSAGSPTLLAFGNPALGRQTISRDKSALMDEKLDPLPEAERQVNVMKQIYGAANSKVYIGAEASEERAKAEAGGYRVLHLATHGILNDSSPMYSRLLLAQADGDIRKVREDGLLEAWEIMKLDLKADLTVLSACETARGHVGAGEGMIGLSWALFVAGCPTSVLSQWKVDSAGTTELMLEFHRQLKSQMATPATPIAAARALREAALKLQRSKEYRHPFYWAGFVVTGKGY